MQCQCLKIDTQMVLWNPRYCPLNSLWAGRVSIFKGRKGDYKTVKNRILLRFLLATFTLHFPVHSHFYWSLIISVHFPLFFLYFRNGAYYERENTWHHPQKVRVWGNAFLILNTWPPFIWLPEREGFLITQKSPHAGAHKGIKRLINFRMCLVIQGDRPRQTQTFLVQLNLTLWKASPLLPHSKYLSKL